MDTGPDGPLQERLERAQAQTAQLRARLAGLAHTLSGSYEELARQNDQLARNRRPPVRFDHAAAAKSWRALADTAMFTARAWEAPEPGATSLACPRCSEPVPCDVLLDVVLDHATTVECPACGAGSALTLQPVSNANGARGDEVARAINDENLRVASGLGTDVVPKLFAVGLRLSAVLPMTTGLVRRRITDAVEDLDDAIRTIRRVAFGLTAEKGDRG